MILGHITSTYVLSDLLKKNRLKVNLPALLLGAMLPDLIDKPVAFFFSYPGRGCAHSAIVLTVVFFLLSRFYGKKRTRVVIGTVYAGCLLHLLQDFASPDIVFWPFLESWSTSPSLSFFEKLDLFYLGRSVPVQWWIEIISMLYLLCSFLGIALTGFKKIRSSRKNLPFTVKT